MADQITGFIQVKDSEDNVLQYDVSYSVEHDSHSNQFCVVVRADEMTDDTSLDEATTKANAKASILKAAWVDAMPAPTAVEHAEKVGDVTL